MEDADKIRNNQLGSRSKSFSKIILESCLVLTIRSFLDCFLPLKPFIKHSIYSTERKLRRIILKTKEIAFSLSSYELIHVFMNVSIYLGLI